MLTWTEIYKGVGEELRCILEGETTGLAYEWERKESDQKGPPGF